MGAGGEGGRKMLLSFGMGLKIWKSLFPIGKNKFSNSLSNTVKSIDYFAYFSIIKTLYCRYIKAILMCTIHSFFIESTLNEPHHEKTVFFCICENKDADQLRGNLKSDQRVRFCNTDSTIPLLPKFQASGHVLRLHSLVSVGPGRKPQRPVFSQQGSIVLSNMVKHDSYLFF